MLRLLEVQRGQVTYPESHSRAPSRSHFRAVPWSHSKRLRAGHAELTAVWPLCALTPAASHLGTVCLLRVQAQTPSQGSQPPGCAAMFLTRPGVSRGLTVSLKAGAQNGAGPRRGSSSSPAVGSSHGAWHTSLVTSLAKHLWIVRAQDGAFELDSRKGDRCSLLNSPRRCVSVGEGTGQRPGDQLDRGGGAGGRVQRLPPEAAPSARPAPAAATSASGNGRHAHGPEAWESSVQRGPASSFTQGRLFAVSARGGR